MPRILFFLILLPQLSFSSHFESSKLLPDTLDNKIENKDDWFSRDKGMHFAGSFISTGFVMMSGNRALDFKKQKSQMVAVSFTFSLAIGKELYDSNQKNNHFSYKDLAADMLGIVLAIVVFQ